MKNQKKKKGKDLSSLPAEKGEEAKRDVETLNLEILLKQKIAGAFPGDLVVRFLGFHCCGQAQTLGEGLRSSKLRGTAKKKKKEKKFATMESVCVWLQCIYYLIYFYEC